MTNLMIVGTSHEDLICIFIAVFPSVLLRTRKVSVRFVEKIKTYISCSMPFSRQSCRLRDKVEKYSIASQAAEGNIIRSMLYACRVTKATNTHSDNVTLNAFSRQKW